MEHCLGPWPGNERRIMHTVAGQLQIMLRVRLLFSLDCIYIQSRRLFRHERNTGVATAPRRSCSDLEPARPVLLHTICICIINWQVSTSIFDFSQHAFPLACETIAALDDLQPPQPHTPPTKGREAEEGNIFSYHACRQRLGGRS